MPYKFEFPCKECGKKHFKVLPNKTSALKKIEEGTRKVFCSKECKKQHHKRSYKYKECLECKKDFRYFESNGQVFCSYKCYHDHMRKHPEKYELYSKAQTMRSKTNKSDATSKMLETKLEKGLIVDWNDATWKQWYRRCNSILQKRRKEMVGDWDGYDYIDNKYIKDNLTLPYHHKDYPTLDHVIPKQKLYLEGYTPEQACAKENLKWTTRSNNSKKGYE